MLPTGNARNDGSRGRKDAPRLPRAVRALVWLTALIAVGLIWYRAYPHVTEPFRQAALVEQGNRHTERIALIEQREKETLRKQVELANTDEGRRHILRMSGFVKKGQSRIMGDGVGAPPAKR